MHEVRVPDVGEGLRDVELLEWHVNARDAVKEDQPLADVQTDKAIVALPCPVDGVVAQLCAEPGDRLVIGEVLAVIDDGSGTADDDSREQVGEPAVAEPAAAAGRNAGLAKPPTPLASPAVRRKARELGVDLAAVVGSGRHSRITAADVERAVASCAAPAAELASVPAAAPRAQPGEVRPLRGLRRSIARTLTEAWQTIPHVIDYREVDVSALLQLRHTLKAHAEREGDRELASALTITALLTRISAAALRKHPLINASIDMERDEITLHSEINVGLAAATQDGLVVPVLRHADTKSLREIALEAAALLRAARAQRLIPEQLSRGTFTLNNYGSMGIWLGTPIIKPPEVANLGFGAAKERAVVVDGDIIVRPIVAIACSGDHRLLDGDTLAAFVSTIVRSVEQPEPLVGERI